MILDQILQVKRREIFAAERAVPLPRVTKMAAAASPALGFAAALRPRPDETAPRLIAEIKKVSPAKGALAPDMDVRAMARMYAEAGAAAISVLTDRGFFAGSIEDLRAVRAEVRVPVLRKDFVISPYQLFEARAAGADAALLIAGALALPLADLADLSAEVEPGPPDFVAGAKRMAALLEAARAAGLDCLVEVHDAAELDAAVACGAEIIGINNRDLRTFETALETTERLASRVPAGAILVSESGIHTAADVRRVRRAGASAVLVGSSIVSAADPRAKIRELLAV